jgi:hypothetical protein
VGAVLWVPLKKALDQRGTCDSSHGHNYGSTRRKRVWSHEPDFYQKMAIGSLRQAGLVLLSRVDDFLSKRVCSDAMSCAGTPHYANTLICDWLCCACGSLKEGVQ